MVVVGGFGQVARDIEQGMVPVVVRQRQDTLQDFVLLEAHTLFVIGQAGCNVRRPATCRTDRRQGGGNADHDGPLVKEPLPEPGSHVERGC